MLAAVMTEQEFQGLAALVIALLVAVAWKYRKKWKPSSTAWGSARIATLRDLKGGGYFGGTGLLLGMTLGKAERLIHLPRFVHLAIFAPTGAGKTCSFLIPWMLSAWRGSRFIFDPKGEVFHKVAAKCRSMGRTLFLIDPFGVCGALGHSFNPLDLIGTNHQCIDEVRALAEAIVVRTGEEKDPHWNDQAANVITAILVYVVVALKGDERCLGSLREIVSSLVLYEGCGNALSSMGGVYARLGSLMLSMEDREKSAVLSTISRQTSWLDSVQILQATKSGIDAKLLLHEDVDFFVTLPPHQISAQARFLRCMTDSMLRLVGQHGMKDGRTCLFLLEEAAQLGHMQSLEQGLTLLRSAGLRMVFFFQSLGQLKEVFRDKENVPLDNTDQIYFGAQGANAKALSERIGNITEVAQSYSENSGSSYTAGAIDHHGSGGINYNSGSSTSISVHARALLTPDEVERLPPTFAIAFIRGMAPLIFQRIAYFDPFFQRFSRLRRRMKWLVVYLLAVALLMALVNSKTLFEEVKRHVEPTIGTGATKNDAPATRRPGEGGHPWQPAGALAPVQRTRESADRERPR